MEPKSIFTELKKASLFDVFLVSFLLLPFVLLGWIKVMKEIEVTVSITSLSIVTVIYAAGIAMMKVGTEKIRREDHRFQKLRQSVMNYLNSYTSEKASFNQIRRGLKDSSISNDQLEELIRRFSKEFCRQSYSRGNPAIGLVREIGEEPDETGNVLNDVMDDAKYNVIDVSEKNRFHIRNGTLPPIEEETSLDSSVVRPVRKKTTSSVETDVLLEETGNPGVIAFSELNSSDALPEDVGRFISGKISMDKPCLQSKKPASNRRTP